MPEECDINLLKAMEVVDGDKELLRMLVGVLLEEYPSQLTELKEFIEKNDSEQLQRMAHSLKGSVGNFGAEKAYALAYELEVMGRDGRLGDARRVIEELEQQMNRVKTFFSMPDWDENL